ncbi:MAG: PAS domain S-box protein [Bacteroidota bacterium]
MKNTDFYNLFEFAPIPMWVFDIETLYFLEVNLAAVKNYGYSKDEFLAMKIFVIRPKEDEELIAAIVKNNRETGVFFKDAFTHLRKNGEKIFVQVQSNKVYYNGREARIVLATDITEKLKIEQALLMSEQRFKALVQDGSDMITIIDRDFNYTYVSPASLRVFGIEPEFFIGKNAFQYIHRDDLPRLNEEAAQIWEKKQILLSPYRYRDMNGEWLWIETKATNLLDDPAVQGIVCTSKDITERIVNEKIIHENVDRYNMVSKATSDIIWDCSLVNDTILWNRALDGILKYDNISLTTIDWWKEHIHPIDRARVVNGLNEVILKGIEKWTDEYRFLCGDGSYKYIFDRGFVILDEDNKPTRMIGAMQDITKRKEEEQWSKLLESVVVNTSDGVLITDSSAYPGPYIVYVNDAMLQMSGYNREELIGSPASLLHGNHSQQEGLAELNKAVANHTESRVELSNYTKKGIKYEVSITVCPVMDAKGKLTSWISIQRDITDQKKHVEEIENQNRKLKDIRWLQSHGVRAPLARIMSLVNLLSNNPTESEKIELMNFLMISATELDKIVTVIANQTPSNLGPSEA